MRIKPAYRLLAAFLCLAIVLTTFGVLPAFANAGDTPPHTEHTAECGHAEAVEGQPCTHVHDEVCGYLAPDEGQPCSHVHDEVCGCTEDTPCAHTHDNACGFIAPDKGHTCEHVHDDICGYVEAVDGRPCKYAKADPDTNGEELDHPLTFEEIYGEDAVSLADFLKEHPEAKLYGPLAGGGITPFAVIENAHIPNGYFSAAVTEITSEGALTENKYGDNGDTDAMAALWEADYTITPATYAEWQRPVGAVVDEAYLKNGSFPKLEGYATKSLTIGGTVVGLLGVVEITGESGEAHRYVYWSAEITADVMSSVVLREAAHQIQINYAPVEYDVTYEVYVDGILQDAQDATFGTDAVFGTRHSNTTVNRSVTLDVHIPSGYYARVYIGDTEGFSAPTDYLADGTGYAAEKFPTEVGYGNWPLGAEPVYTATYEDNGTTKNRAHAAVIDPARGPGNYATNGTYTSGSIGSADTEQTVRVVLHKRTEDEFIFDAEPFLTVQSGDVVNGEKFFPGSYENAKATMTWDPDAEAYNYAWSFTTRTMTKWEPGGSNVAPEGQLTPGNRNAYDVELRSLSVNGADITIPFIPNPPDPDKIGDKVDPTARATAETTLPSGAVVRLTVEIDTVLVGKTYTYQRKYTVEVIGTKRNVTISGGTLINDANVYWEVVVDKLFGVDFQIIRKPGSVTNKPEEYSWQSVPQAASMKADSGDGTDFAFKYGVLSAWEDGEAVPYPGNARFRLQEGYGWANNNIYGVTDQTSQNYYPTVRYIEQNADTPIPANDFVEGGAQIIDGGDGWFYIVLTNPQVNGGSSLGHLTIQAVPLQYEIVYQDGITGGSALQQNGKPDAVKDGTMPDFSSRNNRPEQPNVDTNAGGYYAFADAGNYSGTTTSSAITIHSSSPMDAGRDSSEDPSGSVFKYWVLTDRDGNPLTRSGKLAQQESEWIIIYPNDLQELKNINDGATVLNAVDQHYAIYLTAYWEALRLPFTYTIVFVYYDTEGVRHEYEQTYERSTFSSDAEQDIVIQPEAQLIQDWLKANPWYRLALSTETVKDNTLTGLNGNGEFVYPEVANGGSIEVTFISTLGSLSVGKTVEDVYQPEDVDDRVFQFDVSFVLPGDDPATAGDESDYFNRDDGAFGIAYTLTKKDGATETDVLSLTSAGNSTYTGAFPLKNGETIDFGYLPNGTGYTVTETEQSAYGYTVTVDGVDAKAAEGAIVAGTNPGRAFHNARLAPVSLQVTKTVTGNMGSRVKAFTFTVTFSNPNYSLKWPIAYQKGSGTDTPVEGTLNQGEAFTLAHGEYIVFLNLPYGTTYTLTEANDGYTTKVTTAAKVTDGPETSGTLEVATTVAYCNSLTGIVPTDSTTEVDWLIPMLLMAFLSVFAVLLHKPKRGKYQK